MRFRRMLAALAAVAVGTAFLGTALAKDKDDDIKDVKGCMAFQNKVRPDLNKQLKADEPNWEGIQKQTHEWVKVAESLGGLKPPIGSDASWKEQSAKYLTNVKAVDAAADKKDAEGIKKGLATIQASCGGCHKNHKPPEKKE